MTGKVHDIKNVRRVVVLVEELDGQQYGYEVFRPTALSWRLTGSTQEDGSHARVVVDGAFHRKGRSYTYETLDGRTHVGELEP